MGNARLYEFSLKRKRFEKCTDLAFFLNCLVVGRLFPHALEAFDEHVDSYYPEHQNIRDLDDEIGIAHRPEDLDALDAQEAADKAACQQIETHLEIDIADLP